MLRRFFPQIMDPEIEALSISEEQKSMLYFIKKYGTNGASTFALQGEQYGNISRMVQKLIAAGAIIETVKLNVIDKRGNIRKRIAHRIYKGIDHSIAGTLDDCAI